jgi:hypothetical protein
MTTTIKLNIFHNENSEEVAPGNKVVAYEKVLEESLLERS